MTDNVLDALKTELERFGAANDGATTERSRRMLNITRDTGEFLAVLVRATAAQRILEIGTSNGYSTLWLGEAAQATGGLVTTVEVAADKLALATATVARSGLAAHIRLVHDDAGRVLQGLDDATQDLVFLDADRASYVGWWEHVRRILRPGGLLVVDNATSHRAELAGFVARVSADTGFAACVVPVGNGELVAVKGTRAPVRT